MTSTTIDPWEDWGDMIRKLTVFQGILHSDGALSGEEMGDRQRYIDALSPELRDIALAYVRAGRDASILRIDEHTIGVYILENNELYDEEAQATPLKPEATFSVPPSIAAAIEWEAW